MNNRPHMPTIVALFVLLVTGLAGGYLIAPYVDPWLSPKAEEEATSQPSDPISEVKPARPKTPGNGKNKPNWPTHTRQTLDFYNTYRRNHLNITTRIANGERIHAHQLIRNTVLNPKDAIIPKDRVAYIVTITRSHDVGARTLERAIARHKSRGLGPPEQAVKDLKAHHRAYFNTLTNEFERANALAPLDATDLRNKFHRLTR